MPLSGQDSTRHRSRPYDWDESVCVSVGENDCDSASDGRSSGDSDAPVYFKE